MSRERERIGGEKRRRVGVLSVGTASGDVREKKVEVFCFLASSERVTG